jgi:alkanesulfonate monooxygenase SsuD/methylene tetrahydromethanopterin reductase-like flavin-dependent oxidoreductase (luciferase family)
MKVGLFDHVEQSDRALATVFDERLTFVAAADEAAIYCLHVAEHHATPLNMVPVPGVYLGAVARATKRIRLGPLVYLLPLYSPLRLIEEIFMLDHGVLRYIFVADTDAQARRFAKARHGGASRRSELSAAVARIDGIHLAPEYSARGEF